MRRGEVQSELASGVRVCGIVERGPDGRALTADELGWFGAARRRLIAGFLTPAAAAFGWAARFGAVRGMVRQIDGTPRPNVRAVPTDPTSLTA